MVLKSPVKGDLVDEFRARLDEARRRILEGVATTDEELATLEAHQPGSPPEDAPTELAAAVLSRLEGMEKHELDAIAEARARLATGVYGVCERCHRSIPIARLRAIPITRYCVSCQHREER